MSRLPSTTVVRPPQGVNVNPEVWNLLDESVRLEIQLLKTRVEELEEQPATLHSQEPQLALSSTKEPSASPFSVWKIFKDLPTIPKFNGKQRQRIDDFLYAAERCFRHAPSVFEADTVKIDWIVQNLEDTALTWYRALDEQSSGTEPFSSYQDFRQAFRAQFGEIAPLTRWYDCWYALKQQASVAEHINDFRTILIHLGDAIPEQVQLQHFRRSLKASIQDELARLPEPTSIKELMDLANRIDQRQHEYQRGRGNISPFRTTTMPSKTKVPTVFPSVDHRTKTNSGIKLTKVTAEERKRRLDNDLCYYCGQPGHRAVKCPEKIAKSFGTQSAPIPRVQSKN